MGLSRYWDTQTVTSNLFRLAAWVFLRVIPSSRVAPVLPVLYALYLGSWISSLFKSAAEPTEGVDLEVETTDITVTKDNKVIVEKDTEEVIVTPPKPTPHGTLSTLFLSLPTPSLTLRFMALLVNSLLLAGAYDMYTQSLRDPAMSLIFTRVGAVDPDGAKIQVRWPEMQGGVVRVLWRQTSPALESPWKVGPLISLSNKTDWVGVGRIGGLWPSTDYEYKLAYVNSTELPYPEDPISFRTFPDPRLTTGHHFKFVVSSCILPNFPYLPFKGNRIRGFDLVSDYIWPPVSVSPLAPATTDAYAPMTEQSPVISEAPSSQAIESEAASLLKELQSSGATPIAASTATPVDVIPQTPKVLTEFMLLLGDFIYADVPSYGGDDLEAYRRLYRRVYASPSFRRVYERLPVFNILDDHEISNNFVGRSNASLAPFPNASSSYNTYNGQANPDPKTKDGLYYDFRYGDVAFFVLDTRLYRSGLNVEEDQKTTMLGETQLSALHEWLGRVNSTTTFKFIVSSVPFSSLWTLDAQIDSWGAYMEERDALLSVMATVPNVFILSGDRHEFAAIEFLGGKVVEFSTSPLSMFYIPIIRTLKKQSKRLTVKRTQEVIIDENGQELVVEDSEFVPEERVLKYLPLGNYKFSAFEVDTTDRQNPTLKIEAVINGRVEWRHTFVGQSVILKSSNALGTQITRGLKDALGKIGLSPTKWF
ncbi:hypothetical protein M422DRAFT_270945 [Sphaerobolus stellatus SS14]|uniref:PhoD-like phosphatase metallophosphatase domain-containing protein n=1 Tax=Sphaerobolus stellatus (strain SS14) TaxID=990650 RepID=A0A0C9U1F1_SPHS4|nr:hypothetical protein M422DRAFT_270945 [Sphaerobolus stellatus SS14]